MRLSLSPWELVVCYVGKSRRDAMFIEKVPTTDPASPFMGETLFGCAPKRSFTDFDSGSCSINISPLRGFFRQTLGEGVTYEFITTHFLFPPPCLLPPAYCLLLFPVAAAETRGH